MGYVRMIRTGVLEYLARANASLPDAEVSAFAEILKETQWKDCEEVCQAADRVDAAVAALQNRQRDDAAAEARDHLRLLVEAFQGPFCEVL